MPNCQNAKTPQVLKLGRHMTASALHQASVSSSSSVGDPSRRAHLCRERCGAPRHAAAWAERPATGPGANLDLKASQRKAQSPAPHFLDALVHPHSRAPPSPAPSHAAASHLSDPRHTARASVMPRHVQRCSHRHKFHTFYLRPFACSRRNLEHRQGQPTCFRESGDT